jgi:hypothetical protein
MNDIERWIKFRSGQISYEDHYKLNNFNLTIEETKEKIKQIFKDIEFTIPEYPPLFGKKGLERLHFTRDSELDFDKVCEKDPHDSIFDRETSSSHDRQKLDFCHMVSECRDIAEKHGAAEGLKASMDETAVIATAGYYRTLDGSPGDAKAHCIMSAGCYQIFEKYDPPFCGRWLANREKIAYNQGKEREENDNNNIVGKEIRDKLIGEGKINRDVFDLETLEIIKDACIKEANKKDTKLQFLYFSPTDEVFFVTGNILQNPSFNPSSPAPDKWYPWQIRREYDVDYHAYPDEHPRLPYQDPDNFLSVQPVNKEKFVSLYQDLRISNRKDDFAEFSIWIKLERKSGGPKYVGVSLAIWEWYPETVKSTSNMDIYVNHGWTYKSVKKKLENNNTKLRVEVYLKDTASGPAHERFYYCFDSASLVITNI